MVETEDSENLQSDRTGGIFGFRIELDGITVSAYGGFDAWCSDLRPFSDDLIEFQGVVFDRLSVRGLALLSPPKESCLTSLAFVLENR